MLSGKNGFECILITMTVKQGKKWCMFFFALVSGPVSIITSNLFEITKRQYVRWSSE